MSRSHFSEGVTQQEKSHFAKFLAEGEELELVTGYGINKLRETFIIGLAFPGALFMLGGVALQYFSKGSSKDIGYGLLIGLIIACIIAFIKAKIQSFSHKYLLTTKRALVKNGFFTVDLTSALYDKITHIEVVQSFVDRILMHHGKIIISTAGVNKNEIILPFVDYPIEFKNILERLINREREQLGRQTGPVSTIEGELVD